MGAGKSCFLNAIAGKKVHVFKTGESSESVTRRVQKHIISPKYNKFTRPI